MSIPFIDLRREWDYFEPDFIAGFKDFGISNSYVLGKYTEEFEKNFSKYCGYEYGIAVSTGLSALETALLAYEIKSGDEVITVGNSAVATSLAISNVGAKIVFCDIGDDFLIDVNKIEELITDKTKAILPVHLFGKICDMDTINKIALQYNLIVIEDACQAHGANFVDSSNKNTKAFSFYPTKNLGALGEGGMVVTNDKKIADFVDAYRNYGQMGRYNHVIKGNNYRINALQCVFLNIKLKEIDNFIKKRRDIAKKYLAELGNISGLVINKFDENSAYHLFVIRVLDNKRDDLKNYLKEHQIDVLIHYPVTIPEQPCYHEEYKDLILEKTDLFQKEILSLPCYQFLTEAEQDEVIEKIKEFYK